VALTVLGPALVNRLEQEDLQLIIESPARLCLFNRPVPVNPDPARYIGGGHDGKNASRLVVGIGGSEN